MLSRGRGEAASNPSFPFQAWGPGSFAEQPTQEEAKMPQAYQAQAGRDVEGCGEGHPFSSHVIGFQMETRVFEVN